VNGPSSKVQVIGVPVIVVPIIVLLTHECKLNFHDRF